MAVIGSRIVINDDEYEVFQNFEDMLVLKRNDHFLLCFPILSHLLIPCGKVKCFSKRLKEDAGRVSFNGVTFAICGYDTVSYNTKDLFLNLSHKKFVFRIKKNGELLTVLLK